MILMPRILSLNNKPEVLELLHIILARAGYEHLYTTDHEETDTNIIKLRGVTQT